MSRWDPCTVCQSALKDLVDVKGVPPRHGSAIFADNAPVATETDVPRLGALLERA